MQRWNFCGNEAFLVLLIAPRGPEDSGRTHLCIQPMVSEADVASMRSFRLLAMVPVAMQPVQPVPILGGFPLGYCFSGDSCVSRPGDNWSAIQNLLTRFPLPLVQFSHELLEHCQ